MAYPKDQLSPGETILSESVPHWISLKMEILYTLVYLVAFWLVVPTWETDIGIDTWVAWALFFVWIILIGRGVAEWWSTQFVVTNRRVIFRRGVVSKAGYEIPIDRVQDVGYRQSVLQRMVGAGDLLVQSSASEGQTAIRDIPNPVRLNELITQARDGTLPTSQPAAEATPPPAVAPPPQSASPSAQPTPPPSSGKSTIEQLEILANLHAKGALTDEEFAAQKAKLLAEG